jgi:hypothetical protein
MGKFKQSVVILPHFYRIAQSHDAAQQFSILLDAAGRGRARYPPRPAGRGSKARVYRKNWRASKKLPAEFGVKAK